MASFYKTRLWKDKRIEILERDNYECQMCRQEGKYSRATTVHHMVELKDKPELGLASSNLTSLCPNCHNKIHGRLPREFNPRLKQCESDEKW